MSLSPRPKGYRNYIADWELDDADVPLMEKLAKKIGDVSFTLSNTSKDMAVVGIYPGLIEKRKKVVGYVPREIKRQVEQDGKLDVVVPILHNIWHGDRRTNVYMTLLEPKP